MKTIKYWDYQYCTFEVLKYKNCLKRSIFITSTLFLIIYNPLNHFLNIQWPYSTLPRGRSSTISRKSRVGKTARVAGRLPFVTTIPIYAVFLHPATELSSELPLGVVLRALFKKWFSSTARHKNQRKPWTHPRNKKRNVGSKSAASATSTREKTLGILGFPITAKSVFMKTGSRNIFNLIFFT